MHFSFWKTLNVVIQNSSAIKLINNIRGIILDVYEGLSVFNSLIYLSRHNFGNTGAIKET